VNGTRSWPPLSPPELLLELQQSGETGFEWAHPGEAFLAVRLRDHGPELVEGLRLLAGRTQPAPPAIAAIAFKTQSLSPAQAVKAFRWSDRSSVKPQASAKVLAQAPHYVVKLAKRADFDAAFPGRISVGRAANKDIVLRHSSIYKFHAWFENDDQHNWYVVDASSTNHTLVRGVSAPPRERVAVPIGSSVQFGSVEALLLDASMLWRAVRAA
jgi:hypothetical protein